MTYITKAYAHRYRALQRKAAASPLLFAAEAQAAYQACTRTLRREARQLDTAALEAGPFYSLWQETIVPQCAAIAAAADDAKLRKELSRSLLLEPADAARYAQTLAIRRRSEYLETVLETTYAPREHRARQAAARFLARPDATNEEYIQRYVDWQLSMAVARDAGIAVYDVHATLLRRGLLRTRVRRQTKRLVRATNRELRALSRELREIEAYDNGLIPSLFALSIDLVSVRAAYRAYEKALKAVAPGDRTPAQQLALYEEATTAIRTQHLEKLAGAHGLQDIQRAANEIDAVLLRVFDLSNREYNELMNLLKRYRDIGREQTRLQTLLRRPA